MFYKRNFILLFLLLAVSLAFSSELTVSYKNYSARIEYDSVSFPGQAFFVKINLKQNFLRTQPYEGSLQIDPKNKGRRMTLN